MKTSSDEQTQVENNRLKHFANLVFDHMGAIVREQGIEEVYVSAPDKFLGRLKKDLPKSMQVLVKDMHGGNFFKEPLKDVLIRFKSELVEAVKLLREEENYSESKHLPR